MKRLLLSLSLVTFCSFQSFANAIWSYDVFEIVYISDKSLTSSPGDPELFQNPAPLIGKVYMDYGSGRYFYWNSETYTHGDDVGYFNGSLVYYTIPLTFDFFILTGEQIYHLENTGNTFLGNLDCGTFYGDLIMFHNNYLLPASNPVSWGDFPEYFDHGSFMHPSGEITCYWDLGNNLCASIFSLRLYNGHPVHNIPEPSTVSILLITLFVVLLLHAFSRRIRLLSLGYKV